MRARITDIAVFSNSGMKLMPVNVASPGFDPGRRRRGSVVARARLHNHDLFALPTPRSNSGVIQPDGVTRFAGGAVAQPDDHAGAVLDAGEGVCRGPVGTDAGVVQDEGRPTRGLAESARDHAGGGEHRYGCHRDSSEVGDMLPRPRGGLRGERVPFVARWIPAARIDRPEGVAPRARLRQLRRHRIGAGLLRHGRERAAGDRADGPRVRERHQAVRHRQRLRRRPQRELHRPLARSRKARRRGSSCCSARRYSTRSAPDRTIAGCRAATSSSRSTRAWRACRRIGSTCI